VTLSPVVAAHERAEAHFEKGEFAAARVLYLEILQATFAAGGEPRLAVMAAVQRLAEIAVMVGEWDAAIDGLELVRSGFAQSGNTYMADYASTRIAAVQNAQGLGRLASATLRTLAVPPREAWNGAPDQLTSGEARWQWPDASADDRAVFFSRYYLEAGQVEAYGGQFERAAHLFRRGIDWTRQSSEAGRADVALCLALASAHVQRGDLTSATLALDLVPVDVDGRMPAADRVFRLELQARLDLLRGRLGPAKASLERAIALCARTGFERAWRTATLNLSQTLALLNQTGEARRLCERVMCSARAGSDTAAEVRAGYLLSFVDARARSQAAGMSLAPSVTEMWMGRDAVPEDARPDVREPTPFDIDEAPDYLTLFEERTLGFFWLLSRRKTAEARTYLEQIERIFLDADPPTDSLLVRLRLHGCACMLAYYEERFAEALEGLAPLCDQLRGLGLKHDLWQALRFVGWSLTRLNRTAEADLVTAESQRVLNEMGQSLSGADLVLFLLNKWTDAERYIAGEIAALVAMKRAIAGRGWLSALQKPLRRLALARRLIALLDYADQYKAAVFDRSSAGPATPTPVTSWSFLRLLTHRLSSTTVAWLVLPDITLVARAAWGSLDFGVSPVSRLDLREYVKQWHEGIRDGEPELAAEAERWIGAALQIEEVMQTLPRRVRRLTFIPDDVLHGVPFAAFRYGPSSQAGARRYVGATHAISVAFDWWPRPRRAAPSRTAVVVGIPHGSGAFVPLPNAARESQLVADRLRAAGATVRMPTTRDEILNLLPHSRWFHIACHGNFEADAPDRSGLAIVSQSGEVEVLTIRDLAPLDLRGLQQVVLSSCWAADNYILPGRWIVSLPSAFCRRGARSVIASLWPIEDSVASRLLAPLYDVPDGASQDDILLHSRRTFIDEHTPIGSTDSSNPLFWASVQLYVC